MYTYIHPSFEWKHIGCSMKKLTEVLFARLNYKLQI